ncbi:hypothetical protein P152DRAFT_460006 [Eremomyces bilateralis CBS 781.70]|uniref:RING finger domain-containing protein n=1 Tax=Eremomyces bilateralis CBS 781.70 TaxID=1392243 RepID=A0A6G1FZI5_9PEZI|nr:uncharacterized protein P152DRAFT_460006 [Eremomyces bilateralis CBS 781.70]KAF1811132.1 hypothetical protein P152DRAFT_460006 [Eremomyces bilateralis CBS 781.70]
MPKGGETPVFARPVETEPPRHKNNQDSEKRLSSAIDSDCFEVDAFGNTVDQPAKLQAPSAGGSSRKRKVLGSITNDGLGNRLDGSAIQKPNKRTKKQNVEVPGKEKRLRKYRDHAPSSFHDIYFRARSQRFYVLSRKRGGTEECPKEEVELTGSTGNIYTVEIKPRPTCSCPHAIKGKQCKHMVYVLHKVLNARYEYVYQLALLSSELREIFARAPRIETENTSTQGTDGKRKTIEGDCPICFTEFEENKETIVYCKAACGQNIHKECFETWASARRKSHDEVTCPFCRSTWEGDQDMVTKIKKSGGRNEEGYVNVADQLGISGQRDYSTYNPFWVNRQRQAGANVGDWDFGFVREPYFNRSGYD